MTTTLWDLAAVQEDFTGLGGPAWLDVEWRNRVKDVAKRMNAQGLAARRHYTRERDIRRAEYCHLFQLAGAAYLEAVNSVGKNNNQALRYWQKGREQHEKAVKLAADELFFDGLYLSTN